MKRKPQRTETAVASVPEEGGGEVQARANVVERKQVVEHIRRDRRGVRLGDDVTVRELIDAGRKH